MSTDDGWLMPDPDRPDAATDGEADAPPDVALAVGSGVDVFALQNVMTDLDPMIGRVLGGRYRVESMLGKGAMGAVYRAKHVKVGRVFAVKVLHERLLLDPKTARRFEREANLAGKLHHANVVGVVDVGETDDGIHYMVMEYAEGRTLGSLMEGPLPAARVLNLAQQLCEGLQHAHEHGLIHRDFKPENVIVETDKFGLERPRIVDFGIAILREDAVDPTKQDRLTTAGLVLGTPHYMAPEHAMGGGIDHRIDLFALGVILYELITGWLPYDGDGVDVARANLLSPTPKMNVRVPGIKVDPLLEAFTRQLMQKRPEDRPETAKAARHLLDVIERDRPMAAKLLGVPLETGELVAMAPVSAPSSFVMPFAPETLSGRTLAQAHAAAEPAWPAPPPTFSISGAIAAHGKFGEGSFVSSVPTGSSPLIDPFVDDDFSRFRAPAAPPAAPLELAPSFAPRARRPGPQGAGVMIADARPAASGVVLAQPRRWPIVVAFGATIAALAGAVLILKGPLATTPVKLPVAAPAKVAIAPTAPAPIATPGFAKPAIVAVAPPAVATPTVARPAATRATGARSAPAPKKTVARKADPGATAAGKQFAAAMTGGVNIATRSAPSKPVAVATVPVVAPVVVVAAPRATPTDSSAGSVANLYAMVGRELKQLDAQQGVEASAKLWARYRQIRIMDSLGSQNAREIALHLLGAMRKEIAAATP